MNATSRGCLAVLAGLGFAWRLWISWCTPLPREDGVNYLWMAERFAAGEPALALGEVFSPLLALLVAVPVALGLEPFRAAQIVLAAAGALALWPVVRISEHVAPGSGRAAGLLFFVASRPVLLGAQVYTEPLFLLVASAAFLCGLRGHHVLAGAAAGAAFWVRPEAGLLPLTFLLLVPRAAWRGLPPFLACVIALACWRGLCGHGFDPVPKLAFIAAHNIAGETDAPGWLLRSAWHLLQLPGILLEALGPLAVLAVLGAPRCHPRANLLLLALGLAVVCAYVPRWRFVVDWAFTVVPLAAVGVLRLPRPAVWVAAVIALHAVLALWGGTEPDRIAERRVASLLRERLAPGERVAGDMTRVLYFAGQRPLAPRHFTAEELVEQAQGARFVVLREQRETTPAVRAGLPGFVPVELPAALAPLAAERGMIVLERRP